MVIFSQFLEIWHLGNNCQVPIISFIFKRFFFYEETEESKVVRNIGNVTASTEVTFEYGVRCQEKKNPPKNPTISEAEENQQGQP